MGYCSSCIGIMLARKDLPMRRPNSQGCCVHYQCSHSDSALPLWWWGNLSFKLIPSEKNTLDHRTTWHLIGEGVVVAWKPIQCMQQSVWIFCQQYPDRLHHQSPLPFTISYMPNNSKCASCTSLIHVLFPLLWCWCTQNTLASILPLPVASSAQGPSTF